MMKWLLGIAGLILILSIAILYFIPRVVTFSEVEKIRVNSEEAFNHFTNHQLRSKWVMRVSNATAYAGTNAASDSCFNVKGDSFIIAGVNPPATTIKFKHQNEWMNSRVLMIPQGNDTTIILWEASMDGGTNPISRLKAYFAASSKKNSFQEVLKTYQSYVSVTENVYAFPIVTEQVKDTILITSRKVFASAPSNDQIYSLINNLKAYTTANNITLSNAPMLNVTMLDSNHYQCTVALPINKPLRDTGDMFIRKMVPGKILVQTIQGGPATIAYAFTRLQDYYRQHKLVSPAIWFESLITDRQQEKDTLKWITKIYYPII